MPLDENALEEMLRRKRVADAEDNDTRATLTHKTDDFEVYERGRDPAQETPAADVGPAVPPVAQPPAVVPPPTQAEALEARSHVQATEDVRAPPAWMARGEPEAAQQATPAAPAAAAASRQTPGTAAPGHRATAAAADGIRVAIVQSTFNHEVTHLMAQWARERATELGIDVAAEVQVPGVYDIPLTAQTVLQREDVDAVVVVGAVIQGETGHDVAIVDACLEKLLDIACALGKPIGMGITGPRMTAKQAEARIAVGKNAMDSAIAQVRMLRQMAV